MSGPAGLLEVTLDCSCGRRVARTGRTAGLDVCPHEPDPDALLPAALAGTSLAEAVRALEQAAELLCRPASACSCPRQLVGDLDLDPDCPGLARGADGCRADSRLRAAVALADAGLPFASHSLRFEREAITRALQGARSLLDGSLVQAVVDEPAEVLVAAPAFQAALSRRTAA